MKNNQIFRVEDFQLDTKLDNFYAVICSLNKKISSDISPANLVGAAFGLERKNLRTRAIFESVERYCLYSKNSEKYIAYKPLCTTESGVLQIKHCNLYSLNQQKSKDFPFLKRKSTSRILWSKVVKINDGLEYFIPYHYVFPRKNLSKNKLLGAWSSSGAAAHVSMEKAIINGVLEVVERDSLMCSWISKTGVQSIDIKTIFLKSTKKIINELKSKGFDLNLFAITNDLNICTIFALLKHKNENFASFGSACRADLSVSVEKAIYEAVMIKNTQYQMLDNSLVENSTGLQRHVIAPIIFGKKMYSWLFSKKIEKTSLRILSKRHLKKDRDILSMVLRNFDVFMFDFSDKTISKKIKVVKCIIPSMQPLEVSTEVGYDINPRIVQFSGKSKLDINSFIHPFG